MFERHFLEAKTAPCRNVSAPSIERSRPFADEMKYPRIATEDFIAAPWHAPKLQYELSQLVPLAIIVAVGVVFYLMGGKTRQETAAEPAVTVYAHADGPGKAP